MKDDQKIFLTPEQAESVLLDGDTIHTFRSGTMTLIGCDWSRKSIIEAIRRTDAIEIGGEACKRMGHGLVVWTGNDPLFIECDKEKLSVMEDELLKQLES